jgi:hypothetical protein
MPRVWKRITAAFFGTAAMAVLVMFLTAAPGYPMLTDTGRVLASPFEDIAPSGVAKTAADRPLPACLKQKSLGSRLLSLLEIDALAFGVCGCTTDCACVGECMIPEPLNCDTCAQGFTYDTYYSDCNVGSPGTGTKFMGDDNPVCGECFQCGNTSCSH